MFANFKWKRFIIIDLIILAIIVLGFLFTRWYDENTTEIEKANGLVTIEKWILPSGLKVYFTPAPQLPMLDVQLAFNAGSAQDKAQAGLAQLTNNLLLSGTNTQSADAIAAAFEDKAILINTNVSRDYATIAMRSLTDKQVLSTGVTLLTELLQHVSFPADAFAREQKQLLTSIEYKSQDPASLGEDLFFNALYGHQVYGSPLTGTKDSVMLLTQADVQAFYKDHYVAEGSVLALVGDLSLSQAKKIAKTIDAALSKEKAPRALDLALVTKANFAGTKKLDFPSSQTHLFVGQLSINRQSPDYFPLLIGNQILGGGGLVSLLFEEVREKRGLVYSVSSYFYPLQANGIFLINLQSRTTEAENALQVVEETVKKFVEIGPTQEQVDAAKANLSGGFPLRIASNGLIIDALTTIGYYDLPLDYLNTYADQINAVTLQQVKDAFARHVDWNAMVVVEVGKVD